MILSKIKKFLGVLRDTVVVPHKNEIGVAVYDRCKRPFKYGNKPVVFKDCIDIMDMVENHNDGAIVIKHGKKNSLIACWKCKKETWVLRGSKCYRTGLCWRCV